MIFVPVYDPFLFVEVIIFAKRHQSIFGNFFHHFYRSVMLAVFLYVTRREAPALLVYFSILSWSTNFCRSLVLGLVHSLSLLLLLSLLFLLSSESLLLSSTNASELESQATSF